MSRGSSHHRTRPSNTRNAASLVFGFFLSLILFAEVVALAIGANLILEPGFLSLFDKDYYQYVLTYINDEATYYTMPTGYDPKVLDEVFTYRDVQNDVDGYVKSALHGASYPIDDSNLRERLTSNVEAQYASDGKEIGADDEAAITSYVDVIMDIYARAIRLPGLDAITKIRSRVAIPLYAVIIGLPVVIALLARAIMGLHHRVHRGMRYLAYATGGACLLSIVAPAAILASGFYKGLGVSPQFFYHFCMTVIERLLYVCIAGGIIYLIVTVVLIARVAARRKRLVGHRSSSHHHSGYHSEGEWYMS